MLFVFKISKPFCELLLLCFGLVCRQVYVSLFHKRLLFWIKEWRNLNFIYNQAKIKGGLRRLASTISKYNPSSPTKINYLVIIGTQLYEPTSQTGLPHSLTLKNNLYMKVAETLHLPSHPIFNSFPLHTSDIWNIIQNFSFYLITIYYWKVIVSGFNITFTLSWSFMYFPEHCLYTMFVAPFCYTKHCCYTIVLSNSSW